MKRTRLGPSRLKFGVIAIAAVLARGVGTAAVDTTPLPVQGITSTNFLSRSTNGPAVYDTLRVTSPTGTVTNTVFNHYIPGSLNNLVWRNFVARTNGRNSVLWSVRAHPAGWPVLAPIVAWNTNCLIWGMKGLTALSPCWEGEGNSGQVPVTALTRRHGYTRGHGMGTEGFTTNHTVKKVWFVTTNNTIVQTTVIRAVVRTMVESKRDYTLLLFAEDLPDSIQPMRVVAATNVWAKYPDCGASPRPILRTEQGGNVGAGVPGFIVNTWKGGDSGSPDMLPMPDELAFFGGRASSGPSAEMQSDMDALCVMGRLNAKNHQLQWVDLSSYATCAPH